MEAKDFYMMSLEDRMEFLKDRIITFYFSVFI